MVFLGISNNASYYYLGIASEHDYKASEFHKYCDNKCPTVTIIKHIGHDNKINIFGGYTTQYWESRSENYHKYDSGSFLFALSNEHDIPPTKYDVIKPPNALYCDKNIGPCFLDICISDDCHNNNNSYVNGKTSVYSHSLTPQFRSLFVNTAGPEEKIFLLLMIMKCSDENRSVKKWHDKCDDKESLGTGFRSDSKAFLFSLTNPYGYNYTKLNINCKYTNSALISNDSLFELTFCCGIYLHSQIEKDRFINGKIDFLCEENNPVYISPYPKLGNGFFIDTDKPDEENIFGLIDFEVYTGV
ncbi:hypothetical protein WA158_004027 [Blastocystis sp. Blastoise]